MNAAPSDAMVTALASVIVALVGLLGAYLALRGGKRAGQEQAETEQTVISMQAFLQTVSSYEGRVAKLERDGVQMKRDLEGMHTWKRAAILYIRKLQKYARDHVPGEDLPEPPAELVEDLKEAA